MKRFSRNKPKSLQLASKVKSVHRSTLFSPAKLTLSDGSVSESGCLKCPDTPCMKWDFHEISKSTRVASVVSLEDRVCPTNALQPGADGVPTVDETCFGCGLCISRCPVHAIYLEKDTWRASIGVLMKSFEFSESDENFLTYRNEISELFEHNLLTLDPEDLVPIINRVTDLKKSTNNEKALQLLVRNSFLLKGAASRLGNPGDNNNWAELVVDDGKALFAVEIEVGTDGLDAARRVVSDVALVCGRYEVSIDLVTPLVVMLQLPNVRTDFYRVAANLRERLGLRVLTAPIAIFIWAVLKPNVDLIEIIRDYCYLDVDNVKDSNLSAVIENLNDELAIALGVVPQK